jgi:hypothetical protein
MSLFVLMQIDVMQVGDLHVQEDKLQVSLWPQLKWQWNLPWEYERKNIYCVNVNTTWFEGLICCCLLFVVRWQDVIEHCLLSQIVHHHKGIHEGKHYNNRGLFCDPNIIANNKERNFRKLAVANHNSSQTLNILRYHMMRSQVTRWNPLEGSTKLSCGKLRLGSTLPASNSRKG